MGVSEGLKIVPVKVLARETKLTSLEARTRPTFLETLISKYDFGPVKLPGLSRNGPLARLSCNRKVDFYGVNQKCRDPGKLTPARITGPARLM